MKNVKSAAGCQQDPVVLDDMIILTMCVCLFDFYYTAQIDPQEASSGKCGGQIKNPNQMVSNHVNSFEGFLLNTSYLTDSYIGLKYPQYGICIQKYNFWPRNDGEKWPRKICFEIPPCITEYVTLGISMK